MNDLHVITAGDLELLKGHIRSLIKKWELAEQEVDELRAVAGRPACIVSLDDAVNHVHNQFGDIFGRIK